MALTQNKLLRSKGVQAGKVTIENAGTIWFAQASQDLATLISTASAGDSIMLESGDFNITAAIAVSKSITLIGQGWGTQGTRIISATAGVNGFNVTSSDVTIKNMEINLTGTGSTTGIEFDGTAGTVLSGSYVNNVKITVGSAAGAGAGIDFQDAGGEVRACDINVTSTDAVAYGIRHLAVSTQETQTDLLVTATETVVLGGGGVGSIAYLTQESSSTNDCVSVIRLSYGTATKTGGTAAYGCNSDGGANAIMTMECCILSGTDADAVQSNSGVLTLSGCNNIVNNTTIGTITFTGTVLTVSTGQIYTPTNVITDRSFDANDTTLNEVADVLGSLITDLQSAGIIG